jgi:lipopolysaccharide export system protein LptA
MTIYLDKKDHDIVRAVSTGDVLLFTRDCQTARAQRVEYYELEQELVLRGNVRILQQDGLVSTERLVIDLSRVRRTTTSAARCAD